MKIITRDELFVDMLVLAHGDPILFIDECGTSFCIHDCGTLRARKENMYEEKHVLPARFSGLGFGIQGSGFRVERRTHVKQGHLGFGT